jgi:ribosomal protein S27AE
MTTFGNLGTIGANFQGGFIVLQGYGCGRCGNGFWTEADDARRLPGGSLHPCPHCGEPSLIDDAVPA